MIDVNKGIVSMTVDDLFEYRSQQYHMEHIDSFDGKALNFACAKVDSSKQMKDLTKAVRSDGECVMILIQHVRLLQ